MLPNNDLSFQLWTSRNFPPFEDQLHALKALGYTDVQPFHDQYENPQGLKDLIDRVGLTAKSGHFLVEAIDNDFDGVVGAARTLGMELVIAPWLNPEDRPSEATGWKAIGERMARHAKRFREAGLSFAWHNHDFEFRPLADGTMPIELLLGEDVPWEPDVGWIVRAGFDPLPWLKKYTGRIQAVHLKDVAPVGQNTDEDGWADVGWGTIEWDSLWPAVIATGATLMVVEHDSPTDYRRVAERSKLTIDRLAAG